MIEPPCEGRRCYPSKRDARKHLRQIRSLPDVDARHFQVWRCLRGRHWHVGRPPLSRK